MLDVCKRRPQVGQHPSASASRLLGLDGFEVLAAEVVGGEWQLTVQTTATVVGCQGCGMRAELHGRRTVRVRDLPLGGRPVVLLWRKRLWRCREPACGVRTWTERAAAVRPRAVLTERARAEACRRVGKDAHAVAAVARDLGVGWQTVMRAVAEHGRPLVDDPARLEEVTALGLDETSFLKATRLAPTRWVTGLVDLERGRLLDVVADRTRAAVDGWPPLRAPWSWRAACATGTATSRVPRPPTGRRWPPTPTRQPLPQRWAFSARCWSTATASTTPAACSTRRSQHASGPVPSARCC